MPTEMVNLRYMVDDVAAATDFYTGHFGFSLQTSVLPAFADVTRGNPRLLLAGTGGSQILVQDPAGDVVELFQAASH